ncbi:putative formamidopyrimidine-DNA glycosylase [Mollisia scopiformis]|uniref:Putative formamidopyrimidine-DNA glycosylase n=1 Tax=Mollisia scopiformis TaxID=149040 RepID=A0A194WWE2_MOLSC|nr:putative formamidopyrimidine-DNA glycosylase [Mollisia scopiformis]KUJ12301.1 putative formamidopyrimidine-DNA glycosylase [Mollisia scopiformis]
MPEIAEVARIVHHLRKSFVGKTLSVVKAQDDSNVFGKVGTSASEFQKALTGKQVMSAGQQGKYFWLTMSSPPHPVFHFGMTGWLYIRGEPSAHYRPKDTDGPEEWPPKYWKFSVETEEEPKVEAAFTDARRFARIRLVDCAAEDIRNTTPLKENGPDPVIDRDIVTEEWLTKKMRSKHVPVKALLLDQANISGIGNWVGDEVLYHAKLHPEQYSDTFSDAQLKQLRESILHVCQTAVDLLADSSKFPEEWLFNHRWGKGKKDAPKSLPNGEKITFLTVGGRTSCVVPSVQKKTGAVAGDLKKEKIEELENSDERVESKKPAKGKGKAKKVKEDPEDEVKTEGSPAEKTNGNTSRKRKTSTQPEQPEIEDGGKGRAKKRQAGKESTKPSAKTDDTSKSRRRSGRATGGKVKYNVDESE